MLYNHGLAVKDQERNLLGNATPCTASAALAKKVEQVKGMGRSEWVCCGEGRGGNHHHQRSSLLSFFAGAGRGGDAAGAMQVPLARHMLPGTARRFGFRAGASWAPEQSVPAAARAKEHLPLEQVPDLGS